MNQPTAVWDPQIGQSENISQTLLGGFPSFCLCQSLRPGPPIMGSSEKKRRLAWHRYVQWRGRANPTNFFAAHHRRLFLDQLTSSLLSASVTAVFPLCHNICHMSYRTLGRPRILLGMSHSIIAHSYRKYLFHSLT